MRSPRIAVAHVTLALAVLSPALTRADALPPQRECPSGTVLRMDHGGGRCVNAKPECPEGQTALQDGPGFTCVGNAPTGCPPGWRGVTSLDTGPRCAVAVCADDAACAPGERCVDHDVCVMDVEKWGGAIPGPLLGAPPVMRKVTETTGICSADAACTGDARCISGRICLRSGVVPASTAPPPPPPPPSPAAAPRRGGCGSCTIGGETSRKQSWGALALVMITLLAFGRRRW